MTAVMRETFVSAAIMRVEGKRAPGWRAPPRIVSRSARYTWRWSGPSPSSRRSMEVDMTILPELAHCHRPPIHATPRYRTEKQDMSVAPANVDAVRSVIFESPLSRLLRMEEDSIERDRVRIRLP